MMWYVLQRRRQKLTSIINIIILMGMIIPISIAPTYLVLRLIGLSGTLPGLALVYAATMLPVSTFIYTGAYKSVPRALDEAATIDGCGPLGILFRIIFPLLKPATVTVTVISFMTVWNDMNLPLYFLNNPKRYTVVLSTYLFYGQRAADWHLVFANIVLVTIPIVIVYFTLQRFVVSGMTGGAIK
jgi:raffinose/stachyose/melibiose transport system permease protein